MVIQEFFANIEVLRPEFRAKLLLAVQLICRWQRQLCREDGSSYLEHLFDVAYQLYILGMPEHVIIAALLHDILEDTLIDPIFILIFFDLEVYWWVLAVTKKPKENFLCKADRLEEYHARWIAYAKIDWTVIFGKAADRLHNLVTLHGLMHDPGKQKRIAQETIDFYVPFFRGEAKKIVPKKYHRYLEIYAKKMEYHAKAFLHKSHFVTIPA